MRITNNALVNNLKRDISNNIKKMEKLQNQLATGRRINKPSDDPVGVVDSLRLSTRIRENEQYQENAKDAKSFLSTTDDALGVLNSALNRVYELCVYGSNGSLSNDERQEIAVEVEQIIEEIEIVANTTYGDKYIFGGTNTTQETFDGTTWNDNNEKIKYEIGKGIAIPVNITAQEVFKEKDMFGVLKNVADHLRSDNVDALGGSDIKDIQDNFDQVLKCRAQAGAKVNRLEMTLSRLKDQEINYKELQSEVDGVDPAELIMDLKNQENVYRASLAVGAKVIMPTLVDYLS